MCGISGILQPTGVPNIESSILVITKTLFHRGPDDTGHWIDPRVGIGLGHCRLSILDLSPLGHQPMHSSCGRYVTVFNGEIYNFKALRKELEGRGWSFKSQSDTEVLLTAVSQWGLIEAVNRLVGMFAFALWDKSDQILYLVRDRMGEKPLYYGWSGDAFLFGSELKALRAHLAFKGEINRDALTLYLRYNYIPAPHTIFQNIFKLVPGTILSLPMKGYLNKKEPLPYWSLIDTVARGKEDLFNGSDEEAISQCENLLRESVKGQMISDVPLGAFLSGGIDSSTVVALMQSLSDRPVKTFTIGFHEQGYNEAEFAKGVARHLGTDHTELYVTPKDALEVIPKLPFLYDEPFSDSSQIPTFLVSQLTRRHVTVSLSGDGGDEVFGGYPRYFLAANILNRIGWLPGSLKKIGSSSIKMISPRMWRLFFNLIRPALPSQLKQSNPANKLYKFAEILNSRSVEEVYKILISQWQNSGPIVIGGEEPSAGMPGMDKLKNLSNSEKMMVLDMLTYLPDDILTKVDRASMGVSLESRTPYLDHRLVEFAWRLPERLKIRGGQGKWLLRQVLNKYVPQKLIDRPKAGFGMPVDSWLRGPLREWAENLLDEKRLQKEGYFNPEPIRRKWAEHLSGRGNWQFELWSIFMFQSWLETL